MAKYWLEFTEEYQSSPLSSWAHEPVDAETWLSASEYSPPLPKKHIDKGYVIYIIEYKGCVFSYSSLEEIDYQGFFIQAAYGEYVKMALFLTEPADQILKERLSYFVKQFEKEYRQQIDEFKLTGNVSILNKKEIVPLVKKILEV